MVRRVHVPGRKQGAASWWLAVGPGQGDCLPQNAGERNICGALRAAALPAGHARAQDRDIFLFHFKHRRCTHRREFRRGHSGGDGAAAPSCQAL
eukprot:5749093-Prymnesium_polylepis.2